MHESGTSSTDSNKISESTDEFDGLRANFRTPKAAKPRFSFPPPPRLCKSENNSSCASPSCVSDSSISDGKFAKLRWRNRRKGKTLPPLGIFWDIENCHVPKNKSAISLVHRIREIFLVNYREAEFLVVCDVKKESAQIVQDLHDTQVSLIHISSTCKNAADEKLRQSLRRFAEIYPAPSAVILISSDVNFAADLSDLRYRRKIHVILLHNANVADALILCANETYSFAEITERLPVKKKEKAVLGTNHVDLFISNVPVNCEPRKIKNRLKLLTDNCGGRVVSVVPEKGTAVVRFSSADVALRAQRRIQGEDVFGNKIKVLNPSCSRESPVRNYAGRRVKNHDLSYQQSPIYALPTSAAQETARNSQFYAGNGATAKHLQEMASFNTFNWRFENTNFNDDSKAFSSRPIDLFISNLDPNMDSRETRKLLIGMLKEHVMVLGLNMSVQADGSPVANLKVGTHQEAQYVISQLHRQKVGYKRIVISYQNSAADPHQLRAMVVALLQEAPGKSMPLFKLLELLETRYHSSVSTSEVNKLKDVCKITGDACGRIVTLTPELRVSPPSNLGAVLAPYCTVHCPNGFESRGWGETDITQPPNLMVPLKVFGEKVMTLLTSHMGALPLLSFPVCYEIEFGEPLSVDENGVPLEHLLTCIGNVTLSYGGPNKNIKYIKREIKVGESEEDNLLAVPPSLAPNLNLLCREVVDLLRTMDRCQLLWSRFIPAYHHHFGRQCRVADYGCTKLIDLFEAIPHVVQLMGDVNGRVITLSHSAQIRRFTSDLLRILKTQASKQLQLTEFPAAYERVLGKPFNAVEYGLCSLEDLLSEVPQYTVVITKPENGGRPTISIPKREQTQEEMERTRQFAVEVVQLLRHSPHHSMRFNKFVPAYHHHFGYQCRVSNYGFTKLIELFEAISDVVKIEELPDGDRKVSLTLPHAIKVVGKQIASLIQNSKLSTLPLEALCSTYLREYGYPLKTRTYECDTVIELMGKLQDVIQVVHSSAGPLLVLHDADVDSDLSVRVWAIFCENPSPTTFSEFLYEYQSRFGAYVTVSKLERLHDVVLISNQNGKTCMRLTDKYRLAADLYKVVCECGGQVGWEQLFGAYTRVFGRKLELSAYGIESANDLAAHFNFLFVPRGYKRKITLALNKKLADYKVRLPTSYLSVAQTANERSEVVQWPLPPVYDFVTSNRSGITPPKPDTPPEKGEASWNAWSTPTKTDTNASFAIHLPTMETPEFLGCYGSLISPTRNLLSAHSHPLGAVIPMISAPDPGRLPLPDKLLAKGVCDESNDSGVINNSNTQSDEEGWKFNGVF